MDNWTIKGGLPDEIRDRSKRTRRARYNSTQGMVASKFTRTHRDSAIHDKFCAICILCLFIPRNLWKTFRRRISNIANYWRWSIKSASRKNRHQLSKRPAARNRGRPYFLVISKFMNFWVFFDSF